MRGRGVDRRQKQEGVRAEPMKQDEKKLQVTVHEDGGMSGRVKCDAAGQVTLGGLRLKAPADGEVVTHQLSRHQLLVLRGEGDTVSVSTRKLGLEVDEDKGKLKGLVLPREVEGQRVVDLGPLGYLPAPAAGSTDSFLMGPNRLLVLQGKDDGTVSVYTRTLGLEGDKKGGFRGDLLPADGQVELMGKQLDVSKLAPGEEKSKDIKIKGKKYKVTLRMNADGSVTVSGARKKSFWSKLAGFVGSLAPLLAAIPGLGLAAVAAKVVSGFNAVKNFVQSARSGNLLGMVSSAAGLVAGFARGAVQAVASKVSHLANVGQQVLATFKHGLGKGLLQVVSNGANLLSGIAGAVGNLGQGDTQRVAYNVAKAAGGVGRYTHAADEAFKGNLLPGLGLAATEVASKLGQPRPPREEGPRYTLRKDIKLTPFDSSQLPGNPLDPSTAPAPRRDVLHYSLKGILEAFPERPDMALPSMPVLVASHELVMPADKNSKDVRFHFVPTDLPMGTQAITGQQARELLAKEYEVPVELIEAFGIYAGLDLLTVHEGSDGVYLPFAQSKEFNELMAHLAVNRKDIPKVIDALRSGKTDVWLECDLGQAEPTGKPTSQANFAVHSDPNRPRFEQGTDNWFTSALRAAGQFMEGVMNGRPGAAGGMTVDFAKATDLQIAAAQAMSGPQSEGVKLREMANLFLPFANTVTDGAAAVDLARNPHKVDLYGRTAGDARNSALLSAGLDLLPGVPGVPGRGPKPKVDLPQSAVRPDVPGTPGRGTDLSAFDKLDNAPVDSWNDPHKDFGTGPYGEAVAQGVHCGGFVCAWAGRTSPTKPYSGDARVPAGSMSKDLIENWLTSNNLMRAQHPPQTFSNSTDAIEFMQKLGGDFVVFKEGRNKGDSGHAFAVTVRNGAYKVLDPAGGYADFIMGHPKLGMKTRVVPIIRPRFHTR